METIKGTISVLKDKNENNHFPITKAEAVVGDDYNLKEKLIEIDQEIVKTNTQLSDVNSQLADMTQELPTYAKKTEVSDLTKDKASITYVDTSVARISSGTPLFAPNIAGMTDITKNYVNTTDGYLYRYNGTNFEKTTVQYQSTGINDGSITPIKTSFILIDQSINVFNKNDSGVQLDKAINYVGQITSTVGYYMTHKIPVNEGDKYTIRYTETNFGAFYRADDSFVQKIGASGISGAYTFTVPVGAKYMIVNGIKNQLATDMVVKGEIYPSSYVDYKNTLKLINEIKVDDVEVLKADNEKNKKDIKALQDNVIESGNPLLSKTALFTGDSICHGTSANDGKSGWAGRIGVKNNMTWKNYGISGGTIATETYLNDGTTKKHWISTDIDKMITEYPNAEYIIFEGGTNDADTFFSNPTKKGEISMFYDNFDTTTYIGAMEEMFKKAVTNYNGKKIGFIIAHKMGNTRTEYTKNRKDYLMTAKQVCEKWGIPYLDLWNSCMLCQDIPTIKSIYYTDDQHLTSAGYDYITPLIEEWMKTL